jgi:hypothetical protein
MHFLSAYMMLSPAINSGDPEIGEEYFLTWWPEGNWRGIGEAAFLWMGIPLLLGVHLFGEIWFRKLHAELTSSGTSSKWKRPRHINLRDAIAALAGMEQNSPFYPQSHRTGETLQLETRRWRHFDRWWGQPAVGLTSLRSLFSWQNNNFLRPSK